MTLTLIVWGLLAIVGAYFVALHFLIAMGDVGLALLFAGEGVLAVITLIHTLVKEDEA